MPKISFTSALKRFYPNLKSLDIEAENLNELIDKVDQKFPGLRAYILEEDRSLRKHVNIFVSGNIIQDRVKLSDSISSADEIYIFQALSGG